MCTKLTIVQNQVVVVPHQMGYKYYQSLKWTELWMTLLHPVYLWFLGFYYGLWHVSSFHQTWQSVFRKYRIQMVFHQYGFEDVLLGDHFLKMSACKYGTERVFDPYGFVYDELVHQNVKIFYHN